MSTPSVSRPPAYGKDLAELILERSAAGASDRQPAADRATARGDLGVTRTMVRHALALLEAEGRISREVGRGTFLRGGDPPTRAGAPDRDAGAVRRCRTGRRDGGPTADRAPGAAVRRRVGDRPGLRRDAPLRGRRRRRGQLRRVRGVGLRAAPRDRRRQPQPAPRRRCTRRSNAPARASCGETSSAATIRASRRAVYQADHERLVDALGARELRRAMEAMDAHLARVEANLLGGGGQRAEE